MFRLLLKHEWRATRGILGLLCLLCLGAAVVGGFSLRSMIIVAEQPDPSAFQTIITMFGFIVCVIAMSLCAAAALFFHIWRFYRSRFSDEGYMTFTLPATTHHILLSSLVDTLLGMLVMLVAVFLGFGILVSIGLTGIPGFYADAARELPILWSEMKQALQDETAAFVTAMIYAPVSVVAETVILMLSVTIGSVLARKLKVLAAIGVYYGINVVISMVSSILMVLSGYMSTNSMEFYQQTFLYPTILMLILGTGGYFLMHHLASRKLDLP